MSPSCWLLCIPLASQRWKSNNFFTVSPASAQSGPASSWVGRIISPVLPVRFYSSNPGELFPKRDWSNALDWTPNPFLRSFFFRGEVEGLNLHSIPREGIKIIQPIIVKVTALWTCVDVHSMFCPVFDDDRRVFTGARCVRSYFIPIMQLKIVNVLRGGVGEKKIASNPFNGISRDGTILFCSILKFICIFGECRSIVFFAFYKTKCA